MIDKMIVYLWFFISIMLIVAAAEKRTTFITGYFRKLELLSTAGR
mgnify:CR=1 FL=1